MAWMRASQTSTTRVIIVIITLVTLGLGGCGKSATNPSPVTQPPPPDTLGTLCFLWANSCGYSDWGPRYAEVISGANVDTVELRGPSPPTSGCPIAYGCYTLTYDMRLPVTIHIWSRAALNRSWTYPRQDAVSCTGHCSCIQVPTELYCFGNDVTSEATYGNTWPPSAFCP
jgi:hypothetical protein